GHPARAKSNIESNECYCDGCDAQRHRANGSQPWLVAASGPGFDLSNVVLSIIGVIAAVVAGAVLFEPSVQRAPGGTPDLGLLELRAASLFKHPQYIPPLDVSQRGVVQRCLFDQIALRPSDAAGQVLRH